MLGHCEGDAQAFVGVLQKAIEAHPIADADALIWRVGSRASAAIGSDLCLLMPWDTQAKSATDLQALQIHRELRQDLYQSGMSFEVLRGDPSRLLRQALAALSRWQPALRPDGAQTLARPGWSSSCERCGDPDCEFRLFKGVDSSTAC